MSALLRRGGLRARLFAAHLLVLAIGAATLLGVTLAIAPTLHDRLMIALLGHELTMAADPAMAEMERATNAVFQAAMLQALLLSGGAASLVAIVVSLVISARIVTPVRQLLAASRHIAQGQYAERVPVRGQSELAELATQFNLMAATLEASEQRRVELIGDVAHELRTPLATIAGYAEGVLDGVVQPGEETWALIIDEVGRLRRLVHDLQELSRAEAHQLPLQIAPVSPAVLAERAIARLRPQFDEKGVSLVSVVAPALPRVPADADRITQVLINLLGNALRYTAAGGRVTLHVTAASESVRFEVHDTGEGIAAEHLPHLFERFYRVDKARARATGGSGIGLTIAKALVEAHGGTIWAQSAGPGQGSCFGFSLPVMA